MKGKWDHVHAWSNPDWDPDERRFMSMPEEKGSMRDRDMCQFQRSDQIGVTRPWFTHQMPGHALWGGGTRRECVLRRNGYWRGGRITHLASACRTLAVVWFKKKIFFPLLHEGFSDEWNCNFKTNYSFFQNRKMNGCNFPLLSSKKLNLRCLSKTSHTHTIKTGRLIHSSIHPFLLSTLSTQMLDWEHIRYEPHTYLCLGQI